MENYKSAPTIEEQLKGEKRSYNPVGIAILLLWIASALFFLFIGFGYFYTIQADEIGVSINLINGSTEVLNSPGIYFRPLEKVIVYKKNNSINGHFSTRANDGHQVTADITINYELKDVFFSKEDHEDPLMRYAIREADEFVRKNTYINVVGKVLQFKPDINTNIIIEFY